MDKTNEIEDVKEMDVKTYITAVEWAKEAVLSESRCHRLASAYEELDELRDRLKRMEEINESRRNY